MAVPKMTNLNNIIALCMSGMTCSLRFPGQLDADLRKIHSNLIPFKNAHFLINGIAPLTAPASQKYRKEGNVLDLTQQMFSKDNVTVKCDPLNPGDEFHGISKARFLASWASWRGDYSTKEVDQVLHDVQKAGSRYDKFFPDWIPNSIAANICQSPDPMMDDSVVFTSNNTAVHEVFDRIIKDWDTIYKSKSYVHVFEQDGISTQDMLESRNLVQYISDEYCEFARWDDKFFEEVGGMPGARPVIRDRAIESADHQKIAEELQELHEGKMFITQVK